MTTTFPAPIVLSNSGGTAPASLTALATCDTRAWLAAGNWSTEEEKIAADCGTATHTALAAFLRGNATPQARQEAEAVFEAVWRGPAEAIDPEGPLARLTYENTATILRSWFDRQSLTSLTKINPDLVEIKFTLPLIDDCVCGHSWNHHPDDGHCTRDCGCLAYQAAVVFAGRLDAIVTNMADGALYVVDHKTTGSVTDWWLKKFRLDAQLTGYTWAAA